MKIAPCALWSSAGSRSERACTHVGASLEIRWTVNYFVQQSVDFSTQKWLCFKTNVWRTPFPCPPSPQPQLQDTVCHKHGPCKPRKNLQITASLDIKLAEIVTSLIIKLKKIFFEAFITAFEVFLGAKEEGN